MFLTLKEIGLNFGQGPRELDWKGFSAGQEMYSAFTSRRRALFQIGFEYNSIVVLSVSSGI